MFGLWHVLPTYEWRKLAINGKEVISEKLDGPEFLADFYYFFEEADDLPGDDLWNKFIYPYQKIHRFTAEVTDGLLRIEPSSNDISGRGICFVVIYPEASKEQGRKFMDTLDARRHDRFNAEAVVAVPEPRAISPLHRGGPGARIHPVRGADGSRSSHYRPAAEEPADDDNRRSGPRRAGRRLLRTLRCFMFPPWRLRRQTWPDPVEQQSPVRRFASAASGTS